MPCSSIALRYPFLAAVGLVLSTTASGCKDKGGADAGAGPGAGAAGCPYKGKSGFCLAPPTGATPEETESGVSFKHPGKPSPAQDLFVRSEDFPLSPEILKSKRDFAKQGKTVLEDVDIAGGKGFFVIAQRETANVWVTAIVPSGSKFFECTFSYYPQDKDALKEYAQACKSLRPAG